MEKPENPSAFPRFETIDQWDKDSERYREVVAPVDGMLLRDYFAAQWLIGASQYWANTSPEKLAVSAYEIADAMLKEREK